LKDTALQQGDVARTSEGFANQMKFLQAEVTNVKAQLGTALLPVVLQFVDVLRKDVVPLVQRFADTMTNLNPKFIEIGLKIGLFVAAVGPLLFIFGSSNSLDFSLTFSFFRYWLCTFSFSLSRDRWIFVFSNNGDNERFGSIDGGCNGPHPQDVFFIVRGKAGFSRRTDLLKIALEGQFVANRLNAAGGHDHRLAAPA
jgi:hypothetical protein